MGTAGMGALGGALYLASRTSVGGLARVIGRMTLTLGVALMALRFASNVYIAMPLLFATGLSWMVQLGSTNTIIQTVVEEDLRGRVMAFYTMAFLGTAPIGSLIAGVAADRIGPQRTILLGGLACIAAGMWFMYRLPLLREIVRPIYVERGILAAAQVEGNAKSL